MLLLPLLDLAVGSRQVFQADCYWFPARSTVLQLFAAAPQVWETPLGSPCGCLPFAFAQNLPFRPDLVSRCFFDYAQIVIQALGQALFVSEEKFQEEGLLLDRLGFGIAT